MPPSEGAGGAGASSSSAAFAFGASAGFVATFPVLATACDFFLLTAGLDVLALVAAAFGFAALGGEPSFDWASWSLSTA
eukprot:scaffold230725_cov30-Tisochrysis_lutea.AAC.2